MKKSITLFLCLFISKGIFAGLIYHPVSFAIKTDKEFYYEGEKITFYLTITNNDKELSHPVLLPHTQNTGQKLFYFTVYDKANNTLLTRYTENKMLDMMVHDTGTVKIRYLKPLEQLVIPLYLNDFENYYNYYTQQASHHRFEVPLFAGVYKINLTYNPKGILLGDSIYTYYNDFDKHPETKGKSLIPEQGALTQMIDLKIRRSADTVVTIERKKYYIKTDGDRYFYFNKYTDKIVTDTSCIHITNLPPDSFSLPRGDYFYSHFNDLYAEYIARFDDGDIREYRKFSDYCPDYIYTEEYNELKQKIKYAMQLPDKRFYKITYLQPGNRIDRETYCNPSGTQCTETTYKYNKNGELTGKKVTETSPCLEVEIDGKKRSYLKVVNLEAR